jgi:hypothetical protein
MNTEKITKKCPMTGYLCRYYYMECICILGTPCYIFMNAKQLDLFNKEDE